MSLATLLLTVLAASPGGGDDSFRLRVGPLLAARCVGCHSAAVRKGKLALDSAAGLAAGGRNGAVVVPGRPEESPLLLAVSGPDPEMPRGSEPLSAAEIETLRVWIAGGGRWPEGVELRAPDRTPGEWWSLQPIARAGVPRAALPRVAASGAEDISTPIDAFIVARLRESGLDPSPPAPPRTLIRRLTQDLTGLPPSREEVESFLADSDVLAYERLVDRLLASPRYGERWARRWLDVVHYGDSHGYDKDKPRPHAWPYRDYVIRSFNDDKDYGRFVAEQIAGDVLRPETAEAIAATGFIAAGPWDFIGHAEVAESKIDGKIARNLDRDDMVATTLNTFLSTTVQCARCHDHKFDPVSQREYYGLQAVFAALDRADRPYDLDPEIARQRRQLEERKRLLAAGATAAAPERDELAAVEAELAALPPPSLIFAGCVHTGSGAFSGTGASGGRPREVRVLIRGDVTTPGDLVEPGRIAAIGGGQAAFGLPAGHGEGERREALASWIVDADNPLTWRSIVNRVWQQRFQRGIVATASDFGRMGARPTHPALLDWLAVEFRDGDRSIKRLDRAIVTSAVYRQSSAHREDAARIDGDNHLLWRMVRRRLDAEEVRDAVLLAAELLDLRMYGPGFQPFVIEKPEHSPHYQYHLHDPDDPLSHRRAVYQFIVRSQQDPFLEALDCADASQRVERRGETLTALQALALLNDKFMVRHSERFAERLERDGGGDVERCIDAAVAIGLGRAATEQERAELSALARAAGLENACRAIFNLSEFIYID